MAVKKTSARPARSTRSAAVTFDIELGEQTDPKLVNFNFKNDKTSYQARRRTGDQMTAMFALKSPDGKDLPMQGFMEILRWFFTEDTANALLELVADDRLDFDRIVELMEKLVVKMGEHPTK